MTTSTLRRNLRVLSSLAVTTALVVLAAAPASAADRAQVFRGALVPTDAAGVAGTRLACLPVVWS